MKTLQRLLLMTALLCILHGVYAQSAINLKAGFLSRTFQDETDLVHCGQSIGLDAIVEDSRFLLMPGLHYQRYAILGSESRSSMFGNRENIHQISFPVSMGTWIVRDKWMKLRLYGGGHVNFIVGVDKNNAGINLDRVSTVHPGWQVGGQFMVWRLTADVRYGKDYGNVIKARPDSEGAGWEFLVGIAF